MSILFPQLNTCKDSHSIEDSVHLRTTCPFLYKSPFVPWAHKIFVLEKAQRREDKISLSFNAHQQELLPFPRF